MQGNGHQERQDTVCPAPPPGPSLVTGPSMRQAFDKRIRSSAGWALVGVDV